MIGCHQGKFAAASQVRSRSDAQFLTREGHELLNQGKAEEALKNWSEATSIYSELGLPEGVTGSQINQSLALRSLGQYRRACMTLLSALKLDSGDNLFCKQPSEIELSSQKQLDLFKQALVKQKSSSVNAIGLRILGDVLRDIGNLEESQSVLQESLKMSERLQLSPDVNANLLSLGNTKQALYNKGIDLYERTELSRDRDYAIKIAEQAFGEYQEAVKQAENSPTAKVTQIQAKLNYLSFLLKYESWLKNENSKGNNSQLTQKLNQFKSQIQPLVDELLNDKDLFSNLSPIQAIYAQLNFATSLIQVSPENASIAIQHATNARSQTQELENKRAEAYALSILGDLYEQTNKLSFAENFTEEGVLVAQSIRAEDIAYQSQRQLGRIYEKQGKTEDAIAAYDAAIKTLDAVRRDLLYINGDLLFSFRSKVEPVYREAINLYLKEPNEEHLKKILEINDRFQLTELENFLQCDFIDSVSLEDTVNKLDRPPAAIIYTIILEKQNKLEVIVSVPHQSVPHHYSVPWNEVKSNISVLSSYLQNENLRNDNPNNTISPNFQELYKLLIAPAKTYLPKEGTLIFVLDSQLQNIPMALLQDEDKRYLIEDYSIALSLGSQIREPKFFPWKQSKALIAGVSYSDMTFPPDYRKLDNVEAELVEVGNNTVSKEILTNDNFTIEGFTNKLNASDFTIIHLATHGQFSSNAEKTFILAYDKPINVRQLDNLLRSKTQDSPDPIELLVLSACQTAKGDKRGGLGIAGVAVQAGARSTLASLWVVSDRSTTLFMKEFYQNLKAGATKAEALRQAQLAFLKNPNNNPEYKVYEHPYYWAPFILAGNWL
nr:CHAT domain-containing protein [Argonema antarcticum]